MTGLRRLWDDVSNYSVLCHCSWRAMPWCVLDNIGHTIYPLRDADGIVEPLPGPLSWICDKHDAAIMGPWQEDECEECGANVDCPC